MLEKNHTLAHAYDILQRTNKLWWFTRWVKIVVERL